MAQPAPGEPRRHTVPGRPVTARDDFAAVELHGSYDRGTTWMHGVSLLDFIGDKISHERNYVVESSPAREVALRGTRPGLSFTPSRVVLEGSGQAGAWLIAALTAARRRCSWPMTDAMGQIPP